MSAHLEKAIEQLKKKVLKVGWFDTSKYADGTPVAYVAVVQEMGDPKSGIPSRPFMRPTAKTKKEEWKKTLAAGSRKVVRGELDTVTMLDSFGGVAAGDIATAISKVDSPPLAASTIAARKRKRKSPGVSVKPLVDTGLMIQSVSRQVEDK